MALQRPMQYREASAFVLAWFFLEAVAASQTVLSGDIYTQALVLRSLHAAHRNNLLLKPHEFNFGSPV